MKQELTSFHYVFQITKKIVFKVNYYRCGNNEHKHFSTSAAQFNQPKTDYDHCGQAQKALLPVGSEVWKFWVDWDFLHLEPLCAVKRDICILEIEELKKKYNYLESFEREFSFEEVKELSKQKLKKSKTFVL